MFAVKHVTDEKGNVLIQDPPDRPVPVPEQQGGGDLAGRSRCTSAGHWLDAGWHKFTDPAWMSTGEASSASGRAPSPSPRTASRSSPTTGTAPSSSSWSIAAAHPWFAKLIVFGELAVGLGLIVGALVGVAAFFGALMNMSFLMAGTVSTNPVLFFAAILLILAWKNAGYLGIDRYLLPMLGTPWKQPELEPKPAQRP